MRHPPARGGEAVPEREVIAESVDGKSARGDDDRGMVSAFVVIFSVALVLMSALVLDGGRMLAEHRETANLADSAARAGAQAISDERVRAGEVHVLDPDAAVAAACAFLANADRPCGGGTTATAVDSTVTVTVAGSIDLLLLPGAARPVSAEGTACVAVGISSAIC